MSIFDTLSGWGSQGMDALQSGAGYVGNLFGDSDEERKRKALEAASGGEGFALGSSLPSGPQSPATGIVVPDFPTLPSGPQSDVIPVAEVVEVPEDGILSRAMSGLGEMGKEAAQSFSDRFIVPDHDEYVNSAYDKMISNHKGELTDEQKNAYMDKAEDQFNKESARRDKNKLEAFAALNGIIQGPAAPDASSIRMASHSGGGNLGTGKSLQDFIYRM